MLQNILRFGSFFIGLGFVLCGVNAGASGYHIGDPMTFRLYQSDEWPQLAAMETETKTVNDYKVANPTLAFESKSVYGAFLLSLVVGFGTGNFYAEDLLAGYISFFTELVFGGVLIGGVFLLMSQESYDFIADIKSYQISPGEGMILGGGIAFAFFRAYDVFTATRAAIRYNEAYYKGYVRRQWNVAPIALKNADDQKAAYGMAVSFNF